MADSSKTTSLRVGAVLYGYCEGEFGRRSYGEKRVEAVGADWVVARDNGVPVFYIGDPNHLVKYTVKPEGWDDDWIPA